MKNGLLTIKNLIFSATAKDTSYLFIGNWLSAIWGLFFTIIVARALSIVEFGIFSAAINLVNVLVSLSDIGISSGSVNFVAEHDPKKDYRKSNEYIKAAFIIRLALVIFISLIVILFSNIIAPKLLATPDFKIAIWAAIVPIFIFPDMFFPFILQAKRKFIESTVIDNVFYIGRLVFAFTFFIVGKLDLYLAFWSFGAGFILELFLIIYYLKIDFIFSRPTIIEYKNLIKFSGWIGVNRIISSISGELDIQMLAAISGAITTGIYSISSRIAFFLIVLASSYSSVLAPRMASFEKKDEEKKYLIKSTLVLIPAIIVIVVGIFIADPFIILAFGQKYSASLPVFRALALSQIPFILTVPAVTVIIYAMKKTIYIGMVSFFQIAGIFILNCYFIPKYGAYGPIVTFWITNTLLAVYVWVIVIRHYWIKNESN